MSGSGASFIDCVWYEILSCLCRAQVWFSFSFCCCPSWLFQIRYRESGGQCFRKLSFYTQSGLVWWFPWAFAYRSVFQILLIFFFIRGRKVITIRWQLRKHVSVTPGWFVWASVQSAPPEIGLGMWGWLVGGGGGDTVSCSSTRLGWNLSWAFWECGDSMGGLGSWVVTWVGWCTSWWTIAELGSIRTVWVGGDLENSSGLVVS